MAKKITPYNQICPVCNQQINGPKNAHHVYNGPYKAKSEEDMFPLNVHPECHVKIHSDASVAKELKQRCQRWYETEGHTRQEFIERYGKSYL